jgi:hypothetical protein
MYATREYEDSTLYPFPEMEGMLGHSTAGPLRDQCHQFDVQFTV